MLQKILKRIEAHYKYKKTVNELNALSDKELRDIGISRGMIKSIAMDVYNENLETNENLKGFV